MKAGDELPVITGDENDREDDVAFSAPMISVSFLFQVANSDAQQRHQTASPSVSPGKHKTVHLARAFEATPSPHCRFEAYLRCTSDIAFKWWCND